MQCNHASASLLPKPLLIVRVVSCHGGLPLITRASIFFSPAPLQVFAHDERSQRCSTIAQQHLHCIAKLRFTGATDGAMDRLRGWSESLATCLPKQYLGHGHGHGHGSTVSVAGPQQRRRMQTWPALLACLLAGWLWARRDRQRAVSREKANMARSQGRVVWRC